MPTASGWLQSVARWYDFVDSRPPWMRPVFSASALVTLLFFRRLGGAIGAVLLAALLLIVKGPLAALLLPAALFLTVVAGAAGGLIFSALTPIRNLGRVGDWVAWVFATAGYFVVLAAALGGFMPSIGFRLGETSTHVVIGLFALLIGTIGAIGFYQTERLAVRLPSGTGILHDAESADIQELESQDTPEARTALLAVRARSPSAEYVAHCQRVLAGIEAQYGGFAPYAKRRALAAAAAQLAAAQRALVRRGGA